MKYRHEHKIEISYADLLVLRARLNAVMKPDRHAKNGRYKVRSLYFDTPGDKALKEKISGVDIREKFRIRYYDDDTSFIRLEKKSKRNGLCLKQSAPLIKEQAQSIADGDIAWMREHELPLIRELHHNMTVQGLRPKVIVDYLREPYVYAPGNVRVTLDYEIRTGLHCTDFLNPDCVMIPAGAAPYLLEVKWDEFLPDIIKAAVGLDNRRAGAFSKYAACRIYG